MEKSQSEEEGRGSAHLLVGVGAVVAEHQVGPAAVQQQVGGFERQREALHALAEVEGVPQVVVGRVHEEILRRTKQREKRNHQAFVPVRASDDFLGPDSI